MQTLTIGAYRATLAPTRDVGAFRAQLAKCTGKTRRSAIRGEGARRVYPKFAPGMSTADYVRSFESANSCHSLKAWAWQTLNDTPCTLYSGEDACESLPDGFATWEEFDSAQGGILPEPAQPVDLAQADAPADHAHLDALRLRLSRERERLASATSGAEVALRRVWVAQMEREAVSEESHLGIASAPQIGDDALLAALQPEVPADPPATHSDAPAESVPPATHSPTRPEYADAHLAWCEVALGRVEPDEYQSRLIECIEEAQTAGMVYLTDTHPAAARMMRDRYGYPDWCAPAPGPGHAAVTNAFGMDAYRAGLVLKARAERRRNADAAAQFQPGQRFAALIFADFKRCTGAEVVAINAAGSACKITAKRGRASVEIECDAYALQCAVDRAHKRRDTLAAKRAKAKPAPLPGESAPADAPPGTADPLPGDTQPDAELRMLETVLQLLQNAAPDGAPTAQGLESEAGRIDATAERMRTAAPQYAAECAEVARSLRDLAETERARAAPQTTLDEPTEQMRAFWRRQQCSGQPLDTIYAAIAQPGHQQPAGYCVAWYARDAGRAALEAAREPCTSVQRFDPPGGAAPDPLPAIPDAIEAQAREIIDAMPAIDLYDYLADYTGREPRDEDARHPDAMRSAVLDEMRRSGAAQFMARMRPEGNAPAIPGLDMAELGADGLAEFERARREQFEITAAGYRAPTPPLRIPATDPRARIPARFAPGYMLRA